MTQHRNPFEVELDKNDANYVPLSPLSFLRRTASVYPNRLSVIHGDIRRTWAESYERCVRLASALSKRGVGIGNTVAVMAPNVPELFEAHYGVPMVGGVLNALNIRLDAEAIAFQLQHGEAKVLITDREFSDVINKAVHMIDPKHRPIVIDIDDPLAKGGDLIGQQTYEQFLETGDPDFHWELPKDEWQSIALNYTSGTTGNPKGVVYHHRGAYLNAIGNIVTWAMPHHPVYLWTLPMFHCNGWCFPWTITAQAGTHVCLRGVDRQGHVRCYRRPWRDPYVRRADRDGPAGQRAGRSAPRHPPGHQDDDRRRRPARGGDREDRAHGLRHHPCLWPDRGLWPRRGLRLARRVGQPADRGARRLQGSAGRHLSSCRKA